MTREEFRDHLVDDLGEAFAVSYFDRSDFVDGRAPMVQPWSFVAMERFKDRAGRLLERLDVRMIAPDPEHLRPRPKGSPAPEPPEPARARRHAKFTRKGS